jgi:Spy/CpxP family protein refolding chaperone
MTLLRGLLVTGATVVLVAVSGLSSVKAQPPGGGPGGFGFGFGGGLADVLRREDVQKELELLDDQVEKLRQLGESQRDRMREKFAGLQDVPREDRMEKARELMRKAQQDTEEEIGKILLPFQMKRAKQLAFQIRMRGGATRAMLSDPVAEELGLTESQKERIRTKAEQLEEELRKKIAELRTQAQDELLKELTPPQQAQWKEMVGDPFEFQRIEFPRLGGGQPGQGGPGGRFGGRGGRGGPGQ